MASGQKIINVGVNVRMLEQKPSGIQNFIYGLFNALLKTKNSKDFNYVFFSTGENKVDCKATHIKANSQLLKFLKKIDIRLMNIFFDNIYVLKLIKKYKIDVFISPSYILPLYKQKGVRYITVVHDLSYLSYKHNPWKIYMNLVVYMKTLMPFVLEKADRIVVPSGYSKKTVEKVYRTNLKKIKIIYEGKDYFFYPVRNRDLLSLIQRKYKISKDYIFANATNPERKNLYGLIMAFGKVKAFDKINTKNDFQLVISGLLPKESIANVNNFIKKLKLKNKVKFIGFVAKEDLRTLYSFARLFVFPSFEEGFGLPILESVSCGCLPICSNTGALPEVIGNKKLLFDPYKINNIANKINEVLSWDRGKQRKQFLATKKYIKQFSWQKAALEFEQLLT